MKFPLFDKMSSKKNKRFERVRQHSFIDCFDEKSVVLDLGANKGAFSRKLMKNWNFSKLILVEGNPNLVRKMRILFRDKKNVDVINALIGSKAKKHVKFYISNNSVASSVNKNFSGIWWWRFMGLKKIRKEISVEMITLSDIFKMFHLKKIDLVKIDIEGSEWELLDNFSEKDFRRVDQVAVEFHDFINKEFKILTERAIKKLQNLGYLVYRYKPKSNYDVLFYKKNLLRNK
jgi:FkbM family methyltransferase